MAQGSQRGCYRIKTNRTQETQITALKTYMINNEQDCKR